jgi:tryptophan synthase alpha chain
VADGAVIQRADLRVLQKGVTTAEALGIIKAIRARNPDIPMGILTYANLVVHHQADAFYASLKSVGVDSLLIADLPTLEAEPFVRLAKKHDVAQVMIVPPNIDDERLQYIAKASSGYVYVVTRRGVTGSDEKLNLSSQDVFAKLRKFGAPPALYGFGISTPAHVKEACAVGAAGAISGSAVVGLIERHKEKPEQLLKELSILVRAMKESSKGFPSELSS